MKEQILIVEDQFVEADYVRLLLEQAGYGITGMARSVDQALELIKEKKPDFVLLDIFLKGKQTGIDLAKVLATDNIPFVFLSANSNEEVLNAAKQTHPYGFLVKPFREKDLLVALEIARYRHAHSMDARYHKETELRKLLKSIVTDAGTWPEKLLRIATALQSFIPFDFLAVGFDNIKDPFFKGRCFLRTGFDEYQEMGLQELATVTGMSGDALMALQAPDAVAEVAAIYKEAAFENICRQPSLRKLFADSFQLRSHLEMPMRMMDRKPFSFCLFSRRPDAYTTEQLELFERIQFSLMQTIEHLLQQEMSEAGKLLQQETKTRFDGIVGKSHLLLNVFDYISQVAPSDTSVLILGESGTGKEKIADCIHNLSARKGKPFVKLNCAALPATLIESELFGHEKGAFTGALEKRIGKFERADKGTLFLDEVGEMPVELQVKLLRVLQEKEIERVGGRDTIKVDVRIIAATNKNLEKEVADGRFRLDLYYRLNVFPITLPPLRDRREDIPALGYHFMNHYSHKAGKKLSGISDNVLRKMMAYNWPGNIRELEHLIERSVLLSKGPVIEEILLPTVTKKQGTEDAQDAAMKTIVENEKDYIISVLKKCNGRIWGPGAAAEILNINPSTLKSKMKKLGIKKEYME
ncbi:Fis family transcriptional regulator [Niastella koreensis]|uniref:Sigma54 specific transcriptional regulator, Fis family n=2 Tax=Niastella koreensis TaxID=354356 RepID=G8TFQ1_NIAKG|nr:sigma 54-interacting response regulator [Niastella koreensis]AEV99490.1 sigma54 specific transcriptional regulator, Fis family [Niastella koreensis GR20-10]OQP50083.1 Fis family transcriptional regulator [Niastella koreensis]